MSPVAVDSAARSGRAGAGGPIHAHNKNRLEAKKVMEEKKKQKKVYKLMKFDPKHPEEFAVFYMK
jgi:hypothetical protein